MRIRSTSSTTASSHRQYTPASGSTSSRGIDTPSADTVGPDDPIPSIEEGDNAPEPTPTPSAPSVVFTPPTVTSADDVVENSPSGESMANQMRNLRLSSPRSSAGVAQLGAALNQVVLSEPQRPESRSRRRRSRSATVNGDEPRHQVRDEEMPPDRFHEPAFQRGFADARSLVGQLATVLSQSSSHRDPGSTAKKLYDAATKLAAFEPPSTRTIGFVGDSGVGKSSLLNSLLDFENFARTSNSGAACTCVATEFHYHGTSDFKITVDWFSEDEVRDQLEDLVDSYQHFHLHEDELDSGDEIPAENAAKLAMDVFRVLFTGRLINPEYLLGRSQERIVNKMMSKIETEGYLNAIEEATFNSSAECSNALLGLTSESSSSNRTIRWPLIRKLKVYSNAIILSKGLVLVDLPGLRDLNVARRNITERYILHCDEIFAVCNIGRATTDVGVADVINLARQARLSGVGIVCTKSDDIKPGEARQDWPGPRAMTIQEFQNQIGRASAEYERCTREMDEFGRDELHDPETLQEYLELGREKDEYARRKREQEYQLIRFLINNRNEEVTGKLETQYRAQVPRATLRIFCVSNTIYWENRAKPRAEALPYLTLSGIIALRRHCISIVGQSQRRLAARYVNDEIPAFLGDVGLWLESGAGTIRAERKRAIRQALDALDSRLTRELIGAQAPARSIAQSAIQNLEQQMSQGLARTDWSRGARRASMVWSGWHHSSYAAFCRNFGDYETPKAGRHNWNEEAMETMVVDMEQPWLDVHSALQAHRSRTRNSMNEALLWSLTHLGNESDSNPDLLPILTVLIDTISSRYRLLRAETEDAYDDFESKLTTFQTDAFSGIRTSIFGELLEDSYRACQATYGTGSDRKRKNIIEGKMGDRRLFQQWETNFRSKFKELVETLEQEITLIAASHLDVIDGTLDILRDENAESEADRDPALREQLSQEVAAARGDLRRIQQVVN